MLTEAAKTQIAKKPAANWSMAALGLTREVPGSDRLSSVAAISALKQIGMPGGEIGIAASKQNHQFDHSQIAKQR